MKAKRVGPDQVYIEYRDGSQYVRRVIGISALTEFLTGAARQDSNLGSKGAVTFEKFTDEWYLPKSAKRRLKDRTYLREKELVKALGIHFGGMALHKVSRQDWETYLDLRLSGRLPSRKKKCSEGTAKKEFKCLRMVLSYATDLEFIRWNVLTGVKPSLSDGNRSDIWLTKDEIKKFLDHIPGQLKRFRDLFEFRIWTGARPEEAESFGKDNVNWETGEIWLLTGKKRKRDGGTPHQRYFKVDSLGLRFKELLKSLDPHPVSGLYFCNPETGKPYVARYVLNVFDRAITAAGITKRLPVNPYDLRGTFATHRAMAVKGFRQLQTEMGHSSPKSIEHYLASASHHKPKESIFQGVLESSQGTGKDEE